MKTFREGKTGLNEIEVFRNDTGRQVVIIPVIHLEREEYYEEIKEYLDSLKDIGYVVFYEGSGFPQEMEIDSLVKDTLNRKFRRITGYHLSKFTDKDNESLPKSIQRIRKAGYVMQSKERLGLHTTKDIWVDLAFPGLIEAYEKNKGRIILTDYDYKTGLNEKYHPRRSKDKTEHDDHYLLYTLRNNHIIESLENSDYSKVVLLYGRGHKYRIFIDLRERGYVSK